MQHLDPGLLREHVLPSLGALDVARLACVSRRAHTLSASVMTRQYAGSTWDVSYQASVASVHADGSATKSAFSRSQRHGEQLLHRCCPVVLQHLRDHGEIKVWLQRSLQYAASLASFKRQNDSEWRVLLVLPVNRREARFGFSWRRVVTR